MLYLVNYENTYVDFILEIDLRLQIILIMQYVL